MTSNTEWARESHKEAILAVRERLGNDLVLAADRLLAGEDPSEVLSGSIWDETKSGVYLEGEYLVSWGYCHSYEREDRISVSRDDLEPAASERVQEAEQILLDRIRYEWEPFEFDEGQVWAFIDRHEHAKCGGWNLRFGHGENPNLVQHLTCRCGHTWPVVLKPAFED